ncbi:MAG TPA: PAS domain S-box protein [Kofleriaceae bacterium]
MSNDAPRPVRLGGSDELFRTLVASVRDYAIFVLDPSGRVATWNPGAEQLNGYLEGEIVGEHFSAFYPPEDVRAGECELDLDVALREGRFEDEGWRVRKDGSRFWANVVITPMREDDRLIGFAKITRDLTERKHLEQERLASEELYRFLVDSVRDYAIFALSPVGNVLTWNAGAERIYGLRPREVIGSHFSRFYPSEDVRNGKCELELEIAARDGRFEDEGWRFRNDGTRFWANVVISPVRDPRGTLTGFSKVTRDLTQRRQVEEASSALRAAEQTNRAKDDFLAMLGHELRNPLAPITTALDLLRKKGELSRELEIIDRQTRQMTSIVDDLLDVSRISQGKITLEKKPVDLRVALANSIEIATPLFEAKQHTFESKIPPVPIYVEGDTTRLCQVFSNLLNNAAKYTDLGGQIQLVATRARDAVTIEVRDNGVGIGASLLPRVFDVYVQADEDATRREGGLGLGLKLVRSLVELHGGGVQAKSAGRGHGSTFTVRLPPSEPAETEATVPFSLTTPEAGAKRVLLVDDNEDALQLMADFLRDDGHEVRTAADGASALAELESFTPDIALLDLGLPDMDGNELAIRIRVTRGPKIRLVALTGYTVTSAATCFDQHLLKPIPPRRLLDVINATSP